jgi:oligopeptide/dipeptide ABC transporter ATP-binding protein
VAERLLKIDDLHTHFHTPEGVVRAVDGVSFEVDKGRTLGVLGESGCGKSVTALSIMRLIPDPPGKIPAGRVEFDGRDLLSLSGSAMRRLRGNELAMIFQEPMTSLNPVYTVGDQISEAYLTHESVSTREAWNQAQEMLRLVGIPSPEKRVHEYPHQLSGGMRQRAMIAMALACRPKLLIADEPTTALDVTIQAQILDLMIQLQDELGMVIMMITHDLGVIAEVSDDVVVMYAGQVVEYAPLEVIFQEARHPYTLGLMASIPKLGRKFSEGKTPLQEIPGTVPDLIHLPEGCLFESRCRRGFERCRRERPPLFTLSERHGSRCWLVESDAEIHEATGNNERRTG